MKILRRQKRQKCQWGGGIEEDLTASDDEDDALDPTTDPEDGLTEDGEEATDDTAGETGENADDDASAEEPSEEVSEEISEIIQEETIEEEDDELTEVEGEEETAATEALLAVMPTGTPVETRALDKIYYYGAEGYGFSFALKDMTEGEGIYSDWNFENYIIQVDDNEPKSYEGFSPTKSEDGYWVFGGNAMFLDASLSEGAHEVKVAAQYKKTSTWYTGTVNVNLVKEEKKQTYTRTAGSTPDYFSANAGGLIIQFSAAIANPTRSQKITVSKIELVESGTSKVVSTISKPETIYNASTETEAHYQMAYPSFDMSYDIYGTADYYLNFYMPSINLTNLSIYNQTFKLNKDIDEGWYDIKITTSSGIQATYEKWYYATKKPVIYGMGYRFPWYYGEVTPANRSGNYVTAYIYGVNITDAVYPIYYSDGSAITSYQAGNAEPLYQNNGNAYLLSKTAVSLWDSSENALPVTIGVNLNDSEYIDARKKTVTSIDIPYRGVFAFEEFWDGVSTYKGFWGTSNRQSWGAFLTADWIVGADEIGIVGFLNESDRASHQNGYERPCDVHIFNDNGDGWILSDVFSTGATEDTKYGYASVYRVIDGNKEYCDLVISYDGGSVGDGTYLNNYYLPSYTFYGNTVKRFEIRELNSFDLIVGGNATNGKKLEACIPSTEMYKLNDKGIVRMLEYDANGMVTDKEYLLITSKADVPPTAVAISLSDAAVKVEKGDTYQLTATVKPDDVTDKSVTWSSNKTSVATVDANGLVKGESLGKATITATTKYGSKKATCVVEVVDKIIPVTGIGFVNKGATVTVGGRYTLKVNLEPEETTEADYQLSVKDGSSDIIDVIGNDIVAKSVGTATAVVSITSAKTGLSYKDECVVTVVKEHVPVNSVSLSQTSLYTMIGDKKDLIAYLNPTDTDDQDVTWESADPTIATVEYDPENSQKAVVIAKKEGTTTITVVAEDTFKIATCTVTVAASDIKKDDGADDDYDDTVAYNDPERKELWVSAIENQTYTGKKITPAVRVYDGTKLLTEKTDYTVSYKNNTNAADLTAQNSKGASIAPAAVVKLKGNYSGALERQFVIDPIDLEDADNTVDVTSPAAAYKAKMKLPAPVVTVNGKKLSVNKDYTLAYKDPSDAPITDGKATTAGEYTITITGKGNYTGEATAVLTLADPQDTSQILMSKVTVSKIAAQPYVSGGVEPVGVVVTYKVGKIAHTLVEDTDFTVSYLNNDAIGTATMILTGKNNTSTGTDGLTFVGEKRVTFKITGTPLSKATIEKDFSKINFANTGYTWNAARKGFVYTGEAFEPAGAANSATDAGDVEVEYGGNKLTRGADYTVTYQNNVNAGTATIVFTGIGAYSGTVKRTFKIVPAEMSGLDVSAALAGGGASVPYEKGGAKPAVTVTFNGKTLTLGKDYTVSYANTTATIGSKKTPAYTVKGKGNFTGSKIGTYTIVSQDLSNLSIAVADKAYSAKKNAWMSAPVITDLNGKTLKAGTDYEKLTVDNYSYYGKNWGANPQAGAVVTVTVYGKGMYNGSITTSYRIYANDINKATITIKPQIYDTGREITIGQADFDKCWFGTAKSHTDLTLGTDFYVKSYTKNTTKGTATVILQGIGEYGGTKKVTFKINPKSN